MRPLTRTEIMLDLETVGKTPGCAILAIGAVAYDPFGDEVDTVNHGFYQVVDLRSCVDAGLFMDPETVMWWMGQTKAAQDAIVQAPKRSLQEALDAFADWKSRYGSVPVLGNGASFDQPILAAAYEQCGKTVPWEFWKAECFRTLKNRTKGGIPAPERQGTHHNALDDAAHQARHMQQIMRRLFVGPDRYAQAQE